VYKLLPLIVGFCTCPINGEIRPVGNGVLCRSTSGKEISVDEFGNGIGTIAAWQKVNSRGQADGKGSEYCTGPKS